MTDKKKVLLVDDDPDFVVAVKTIVEKAGYEVDVAYDGKEGLDKVAKARPHIVILDVMMPVMNGHQTCKALKGDPKTADIPVILLTAVAERVTTSTYTHRDMMESEADDYIPKPVTAEKLLERIRAFV